MESSNIKLSLHFVYNKHKCNLVKLNLLKQDLDIIKQKSHRTTICPRALEFNFNLGFTWAIYLRQNVKFVLQINFLKHQTELSKQFQLINFKLNLLLLLKEAVVGFWSSERIEENTSSKESKSTVVCHLHLVSMFNEVIQTFWNVHLNGKLSFLKNTHVGVINKAMTTSEAVMKFSQIKLNFHVWRGKNLHKT